MNKSELVIFFRLNEIIKPLVKIVDTSRQVVLALIHCSGAHLTLHKENNGVRKNFWDRQYSSVWSEAKRKIAKKIGYRDPTKHGNYVFQRTANGVDEIPLFSTRIDFNNIFKRFPKRYLKNYLVLNAPKEIFWLTVYFSESDNIGGGEEIRKISISLGNFFLEVKENI